MPSLLVIRAFWARVGVGSGTRGRRRDAGQARTHGHYQLFVCSQQQPPCQNNNTVSFVEMAALEERARSTAVAILKN